MEQSLTREEVLYVLTPMAIPGICLHLAVLNFILALERYLLDDSTHRGQGRSASPPSSRALSAIGRPFFYCPSQRGLHDAIAPILIIGWFSQKQSFSAA